MYGLLTKCEVKMAGYWASSFFACLWTETKSRSINSQKKKNEANIQHLDRTNLVNKGFIIWLLVKFCLRDTAGSPERARWLHLSRSGSQSHRAIWFILPAHGACHIIKVYNNLVQICQGLVYTSPGEIASLKNCFCQALLSCASVIQQQVITQLRTPAVTVAFIIPIFLRCRNHELIEFLTHRTDN